MNNPSRVLVYPAVLVALLHIEVGGAIASAVPPTAARPQPVLQETDFSGYWARDDEASRVDSGDVLAGLGGTGAPEELFISQARNGSLIISSRHNPSQSRAYRIGGESEVQAPGEQGGTMTMFSRRDGAALINEGEVRQEGELLRVREVLSLGDGGDTLVIEATISGGRRATSSHLVYRRLRGRGASLGEGPSPSGIAGESGAPIRSGAASHAGAGHRPSSSATIFSRSRA